MCFTFPSNDLFFESKLLSFSIAFSVFKYHEKEFFLLIEFFKSIKFLSNFRVLKSFELFIISLTDRSDSVKM